jgi:hypothetical protein
MKSRWLLSLIGAIPFAAAMITIGCGGEGGPLGSDGGGLPSVTQAFLNLMSPEQRTASSIGSEACADCHGGRGEPPVYQTWLETKHGQRGVGCERCHGNGSVHADNPTKTNIITFPNSTSPIVCAQCHGSIFDDFNQSSHSKLVESPVQSTLTNPNSARTSRCITCHSGLFRTQSYEQGVDPSEMTDPEIIDIAQNTINKVPHSASCATCHDPHALTGNVTDTGEDVQLRHKTFNVDTTDIAPSTTADVFTKYDHICAQCHNGRGADGSDAKLAASSSTSRPNMHDSNQHNMLMGIGGSEGPGGPIERNMDHASAPGQCSKCHMPDSSHRFTVSYDKSCVPCHLSAQDAAARQSALAIEITDALYQLRGKMEDWAETTFTPSTPGYTPAEMDQRLFPYLWDYSSSITEAALDLGIDTSNAALMPPTAHQSAIPIEVRRARHNYYFVVRDSSICPHNPPYARYLILWANQNMDSVLTRPAAPGRTPQLSFRQKQQILRMDKDRAARADRSPGPSDD